MTAPNRAVVALLTVGAIAIGFAAADTYVVVLALPEMMTATGLKIDDLQRAAPIVSGFLLGYVAVLPLIGKIADIRGRVPVLLACLVIFSFGSLITAAGHDLNTLVAGRFIQGVGGGGLIPPILALIGDTWPPEKRGLPLGVVGAVQELGSVLGPLYGAAILAFGNWRDIFWLNLIIGLILAAVLVKFRDTETHVPAREPTMPDRLSIALFFLLWVLTALFLYRPDALVSGYWTGLAYLPLVGTYSVSSPIALVLIAAFLALIVRSLAAENALFNFRTWRTIAYEIDLLGAALLTLTLGMVVLTFATADHETAGISPLAPVFIPIGVVALLGFIWRQKTASAPLIARGTLNEKPAWGSILVSLFVGAALIAALVDIPFFARLTIAQNSQLDAALVLVRFLVALPVGALVGGWLLRKISAANLTGVAMFLSAASFFVMSRWPADALEHTAATLVLLVCGFGFGLAVAPVNDALLASTKEEVHGLASALLIVARMIGMLVGISALTTLGLNAFHKAIAALPPVTTLCNGEETACAAYANAIRDAGIAQLHAVFSGAMVCALVAGTLGVVLLRTRATVNV